MSSHTDYPLVSLVMCTYNGEKYVASQLDSLINQSYPNTEIIVVDDCSTDTTPAILRQYEESYSTVRVIINRENLGYVKNFEKAMKAAAGVYIAPSDQDDVWEKDKISVLISEIADSDIVYCDSLLIDSEGKSLGKKLSQVKQLLPFDDCLNYAIGNTAAGHAMLITRELVERCFPFPDMIPHDYWLGFVATFRMPLKFVNLPLVRYRQHNHNVFGAVKVSGGRIKRKVKKAEQLNRIRKRMSLQYEKCPENLLPQKAIYKALNDSYASFSLKNNFKRMLIFFRHRSKILAFKKKSSFRKWLFCFKMFYKIK